MKRAFAFEFDPPDRWQESQDGSRLIFHGPDNEELIVSGAAISGSGEAADYETVKRRLHDNAITAMKRAVDTPELIVDSPLREISAVEGVKLWTIESRSTDGQVVFLQGAVLSDIGALLVTLEAPPNDSERALFRDFLRRVRRASVSEVAQ
jgi:hypothetical protein